MRRRVAVTGIGLISPHGQDHAAVFGALCRGESAIRAWNVDGAPPAVAGRVAFDPVPWFSRLQLSGVDRVSQMAVAAAELARADAGLSGPDDKDRAGVYLGCGLGGSGALEAAYGAFFGGQRVPPLSVVAGMTNAPAAHVAMRFGITGPVMTYSVACASSGVALGEAARAIAHGQIDMALAGGAEALLHPGVLRAWQAMQTLAAPDPAAAALSCKPFARDRNGLVLAEGAAVLCLEPLEAARARGATIYAELAGYAARCDATHLTKPDAAGQVRTLRAALADGGLLPSDIGYCNAHGTATRVGDPVEAAALREVWGDDLPGLRVGATKSMHGHLLGAAGALEGAITVLALHHRQLPAHLHGEQADPDCALPLVGPEGERAPELKAAISNSFAFGGTNAALVFQHADQ